MTRRAQQRSALAAARALAQWLGDEARLEPVDVPLALQPAEHCFGTCPVRVEQWLPSTYPGAPPVLQWRTIDAGQLYLTDHRFAVAGRSWVDIWFGQIRLSECDPEAVLLHVAGTAPLRLVTEPAPYWFVMFRWLAYRELVQPPPLD